MAQVIALQSSSAMAKISDIKPEKSDSSSDQVLINDIENKTNKRWIACLLDVAKTQNKKSFFYLYEFFAPKLKSFLLQRSTQEAEAEEIIQETFITVWNKANYYTANKAYVSTWIFTIARNKKLDRNRKSARHVKYLNNLDMIDEELTRDIPFEFTANVELMDFISSLPSPQPEVLKCVYFEGKSHQKTADELNLTLGTVKGQIRSGLNRLRSLIKTSNKQ